MNKFAQGLIDHQAIHQRIGHQGKCAGVAREFPEKDVQGVFDITCAVCREERFIASLHENTLSLVCKDCFGPTE